MFKRKSALQEEESRTQEQAERSPARYPAESQEAGSVSKLPGLDPACELSQNRGYSCCSQDCGKLRQKLP